MASSFCGEPQEGGYDPQIFDPPLDDKYTCNKCYLVLRNPVQTDPCGHRFCRTCMDFMLSSGTPMCPVEGCTEALVAVYPDNFCRREILEHSVVKCRNSSAGCEWKEPLGSLQDHYKTCPFALVFCRYLHQAGSGTIALRGRLKSLTDCGFLFPGVSSSRSLKMLVTDGKKHGVDASSSSSGSFVMLQQPKEADIPPRGVKPEEKQAAEIRVLKERCTALERKMDEFCTSHPDTLIKQAPTCQHRYQLQGCTDGTVFTLAQACATMSRSTGRGMWQHSNLVVICPLSPVSQIIGCADTVMEEHDLRLPTKESTCFNGILDWKISDYMHHFQEARYYGKPSLYSPPFYTSRCGYKMCACVYLNGDGVGKNSHTSVFFVVMRGEFDNSLSWPFRQKVTLTLLDQSPARKHISETFLPDPSSSSFQRPISEMNVPTGCPKFVSLETMRKAHSYVKRDVVLFQIAVGTACLPGS